MQNSLQINKTGLEFIFDIKGSSIRREVLITPETKKSTILRDNNFLKLIEQKKLKRYDLNSIEQRHLLFQLRSDSEFLRDNNIVDYSLLLAVEKRKMNA